VRGGELGGITVSRLVAYVPGILMRPSSWEPLLTKLLAEPEWKTGTRILPHDHGGHLWSRKRAHTLAFNLAAAIHTDWQVNGAVDEVVLLGHSMGALLVRQAYLNGLHKEREWARHVTRIVLLSGINRGVELRQELRALLPFLLPGECLVKDVLSGSDFVTNLRISWIKTLASMPRRPVVVQVRGGQDRLVHEDDSIDVEGFLEGHQLLATGANHADLVLPDRKGEFSDEKYSVLRYAALREIPNDPSNKRIENDQQKIFFVVHGIRDSNNDWVTAISRSIEGSIPGAEVVPPTFGRFSALQFVMPLARRMKVRWFQDLYSMKLARNPLAKFYFVGHSYGTFLLGHALQNLSGLEFERVVLAGSVLPETLRWGDFSGRVKQLRNYRAQKDTPVAILCKALRGVGLGGGIGTAGYTGFSIPFALESECFYYAGGHDATVVSEQAQRDIVGFLEQGYTYSPQSAMVKEDANFTRLSAAAPVLAYVLLLICALVSLAITWLVPSLPLWRVAAIVLGVLVGVLFVFLAFY
jgi:pimeloyl-ACP methyl ester carboxylesterase